MKTKLRSIITRVVALALTFITGSSLADTDELGLTPKHWYKFNGNYNSSGESAVTISGEKNNNFFAGVNDQALKIVDNSTHPWGSGVQYGNGAWSIMTIAKAAFNGSNATIFWATGKKGDWFGLLAPTGGNSVEVAAGNGNGISDHTLTATVNDATCYHVYTIVYDGNGGLSLYVDGELGASKTGYTPKTNGDFQWGAVQQGMPTGISRVTNTGLDDWRLYQVALTSEQVKTIAKAIGFPRYCFTNANCGADSNGGQGDYNPDSLLIPTSCGLSAGTELKIKSISFAQQSGYAWNFSSEFITLNGVQSDSRNGNNQTLAAWSIGDRIEYRFSNEVIVKVGTEYTMTAIKGNAATTKNPLRVRLFKTTAEANGYIRLDNSMDQWRPAYEIVAEPVPQATKATASIGSDVNWSKIDWDEGVAPEENSSIELAFNDSYTLTLDEAAVGRGFLIKGISSAEQVIKITGSAANVAAFVGKVTLDGSFTGKIEYELDATAAAGVAVQLTSAIKAAGDKVKFIFKGNAANGVSLDIGSTFNEKIGTHLVFDGGTHTFKVGHGANGTDFGENATVENPTVLVTGGATLNFHGHDLCGWTGAFNANGIIKVDDGATLACHSYTGSFFYRQQFYLMPGATMTSDMTAWVDLHGGYANNNIYIPDAEPGNTKDVNISGYFRLRQDNNGIGIYVGKNAKLVLEKLGQDGSRTVAKRGEGILEVTGEIAPDGFIVEEGTLRIADTASVKGVTMGTNAELDLSGLSDTTTPFATGTVTMSAGASIRFPESFAENATIALTSGTLDAPSAARGIPVYVGASNTPIKGAIIKYDAENKTASYSVPTVVEVEIAEMSATTIAEIEAEVEKKESGWTGDVKVTLDAGATLTIEKAIPFNSVSLICDGAFTLIADCAEADLSKFSLTGVTGPLTVKFGTSATVDAAAMSSIMNLGLEAVKFVFTDGTIPAAAPTSGVTYRWEGSTELDTLPFAGTAYAGTIELACPVTYVEADHDGNLLGVAGNHSYVFDEGFVLTAARLQLGNTGNTVHKYVQNGGSITLTKEYDGTETTTEMPLLFAHWPSTCTYDFVGGLITAENGNVMFGRDGTIAMTVGGGESTATFKARGIYQNGRNHECSLTILANGVVQVGVGGVAFGENKSIVLNGGTLGAYDNATITTTIATEVLADSFIDVAYDKTLTFNSQLAGSGKITKTGLGTLVLNRFTDGQANAFVVDGGTLVLAGNTFGNAFTANANGTVKFAVNVSESADVPYRPTLGLSAGTIKYELTVSGNQIRNKTKFNVLTLPEDMTKDDITFSVINADTGNEVDFVAEQEGQDVLVYANVVGATHEFTPTESGAFTWTVGGEFGEGTFKDYDNATFNGSAFATEVTVGSKIEAGSVEIGGDYTFSGSPVIASSVNVTEGAKASFANNLVADALVVNGSTTVVESVTASAVALTNANFKASVLGPSMKFVRLSITATQGAGEKPAVGEFRLYRGNAATGYTIVDWPVGTKISESTGLKATKETEGYPAEVGAGLGSQGGNECQPGVLIDGYYGNVGSPVIYGTGNYHTPAYNKWWPSSQSTGPWVVTIEFPYPVATFSGCNFCLADHGPRNPTAWTIEVSGDGINWTTVNETTGAEWSGQHAWAVADDKPDNVAAENWPAFLNGDTTPTVVTVGGDTTIVADGSWTADLEIDGNLTLKGVPEKYLTLDAASSSSFANGAALTFDLSAYSVTKAGKQYVVAGPLETWPEVLDIDVQPKGVFELGKDDFGYYVEVLSGNYWLGGVQGVGVWDLGKSLAWGDTLDSTESRIWLNGVAANFANDGVVTVEGTEIDPTAINFVGYNEVAVEFKGTLDALAGKTINFQSTNDVLTINNENEFTPGAITEVDGANGKLVKKGAGTLTLGANNTFTGGTTIEAGVVVLGAKSANAANGPLGPYANNTTDWTVDAVVKSGATLDLNGKDDMTYVFELENGATLKNTGADIGTGQRQTKMLTLSGDATVEAVGVFGLHNGSNAQTKLELNDYTLTKTGTNAFELVNTAVSGAGTIDVREGILWANTSASTISEATLKIAQGAILRLDRNLTSAGVVFNGAIEGNAMLTANGTLSGAGIVPNLTLGDGATADLTAITVSNLTFGSSMTLVLNNTPTAAAPVKIVDGVFEERSFYDTIVTVKVGDATLPGEYMITQNAEGMFVTESTVRRWTGKGDDANWSNAQNWAGGVPGADNLAIVEVSEMMALTLPVGGVGTIPELRLVGAGTITLDATKLADVGTISVGNGVTFNVACDENVTLALAGTGNLVKQGTGTLTLAACDFATVTVEAGTLDFFVDEGDTLIAASVISGAGAVKKTGAGVLTLSGANTFEGGAEIVGGTLKAGVAGTATSSAVGTGTLKIGENATFDVGGVDYVFSADGAGYVIEAAGTLTNSGGIIYGDKNLIKSLTLTGDLTVTGSGLVIGVYGGNATPVVMNGHKITGATSGNFSIEKTIITGGGEIEITSSELRTDGDETFDGKLILNGGNIEITTSNGAAMSVKDFEYKRGTFVEASKKLVVTGRVINGRADNKIQLADGATIHNDNGYAIQIGTNWGFDGVAYLDADESVVDGLVSLYKQGIDAALVYWSNAGDAFDPSVIKLSTNLKTELEKRGIALAKDEVNKCLKLTRALGFMIMLK